MKKKLLLLAACGLLAGGCLVRKQPVGLTAIPPLPPLPPHPQRVPQRFLLAAGTSTNVPSLVAMPVAPYPTFVFGNLRGNYRVEASSNLVSWWTIAEVYDAVEATVVAEMVEKRRSLFFRVNPL